MRAELTDPAFHPHPQPLTLCAKRTPNLTPCPSEFPSVSLVGQLAHPPCKPLPGNLGAAEVPVGHSKKALESSQEAGVGFSSSEARVGLVHDKGSANTGDCWRRNMNPSVRPGVTFSMPQI